MHSDQQARLWGRKAAQEGIPITSNPYRNSGARAAWEDGHRQSSREAVLLNRCSR